MEKTEDIRIQKSKNAIRTAFIALLKKEKFSKITVKEILAGADVNRSTFYAHYLDKYDLLEQIEQGLLDDIETYCKQAPVEQVINHEQDRRAISNHMNKMLQYMYENGELFMLLYGPDGDPAFHQKLRGMVHAVYRESQITNSFSIPEEYALSAIIGTITSMIGTWVQNGFSESPSEFVAIMMNVTAALQQNLIR